MLTQLKLQPTTKKVSSESIGRQCNPTLYRFPVPQLMGLKSTTLVIPRCRQTKLMGPTTQKQNLNSVNLNYVCGNFLYAKCNEFNNNYVLLEFERSFPLYRCNDYTAVTASAKIVC